MDTKTPATTTPREANSTPAATTPQGPTTTPPVTTSPTTPLKASSPSTPLGTVLTPTGTMADIAPQRIIDSATASAVLPKAEQTQVARFLGSSGGQSARSMPKDSQGLVRGHSEDSELSKRIVETHESDNRGLPVKYVLEIIDVIFFRAIADFPGYTMETQITQEETFLYSASNLQDSVEIPSRITNAISCEIYSKVSAGVDVHTIAMGILQLIKQYSWESKAVLALVAFAVTFGEFRLVLQLYQTNPLAKAVGLLKQLPEWLEHAAFLKPKIDALYALIKEILDVTKKIVEFYDIPRHYFTSESPEILAALHHIPTAVYWSIRSIVLSVTQILSLTGMGIEYLTEPWELSSLAYKLNNIKAHLVGIIERCYKFIEKQKEEEAYELIDKTLAASHIDNSRPLRVLFKEDPQPFYDILNKRRVTIEELRRKIVALFITEIKPEVTSTAEYAILQQLYFEKKQHLTRSESHQYEVIWVPVTDIWTEEMYRWFEDLRNRMEWYSVHHPSLVSPVVLRFFREKWNFSKKPLVVVMDTQGKIVHNNAVHMMCIWGSLSYPFTINKEKLLWEETSWTVDLLADNLEPNMATWINEGRYVCLYGGDNVDWIRKFTRIAKDVARDSNITLELLYVGKNKPKERNTRNVIDVILKENLSRSFDWNLIWYFWLRLESMLNSKGQFSNYETVKNDPVMEGIIAMLSYGSSSQGFAVISHGFSEMVKGNGELMYKGLFEHDRWRAREIQIGFLPALGAYIHRLHLDSPQHCISLILPGAGALPDTVSCAECDRLMEKFTMFQCCYD